MDDEHDQLLYRCDHCGEVFRGHLVKRMDGHLAAVSILREGVYRIPNWGVAEVWIFHGCEGNIQGIAKLVGVKPGKAPEAGGE